MRLDTKKMVFFVFLKEKHGFGQENQLFPGKKMVLDRKTNFFRGKRWFRHEKPTFPRKKMVLARKTIFFLGKPKKNIFLVSGRIVSQKMVFLFFPKKSWFAFPKPSFS